MFDVCWCSNLMMFYDWRERAMSVHGATKHSFLSAIVLTLGSKVVFYRIDAWSLLVAMEAVRQARPVSQDSRFKITLLSHKRN